MMPRRVRATLAFLLLLAPATPLSAQGTRVREVAITFDDLPLVTGRQATIGEHERITTELVSAIVRNRVPAIGFVNEDKLVGERGLDARRVALLRQWTLAGLELGNHGYSHLDLHRVTPAEYRQDIIRGDPVTRRLMAESGRTPRWFRHPLLHTGRDTAVRSEIEGFLADRGYRVAPVTIDNYDYIFARAYDRAIAARDSVLQRRIGTEYLAYMDRVLTFYESQSITLLGRNIPHVLLLHANTLNAHTFDLLAAAYRKRGYAFVSLDHALRDPAYALPDRYVGAAGITWLHRWALTQGRRGADFAGEPLVPAWVERAAQG